MRLYHYSRSSASYRVRIALALKGVEYQPVVVHLQRDGGEQRAAGYGEVNPMRQVPVLEWVDAEGHLQRLTQSLAILRYLEDVFPDPPLVPRSPLDAARCFEIAEIVNAGIQPLQNTGTLDRIEALGGDRVAFAREAIEKGLAALERIVARTSRGFCVGDAPSVADVCLVPQLANARRVDLDLAPYAHLVAVDARCASLAAFAAAHPDRFAEAEAAPLRP